MKNREYIACLQRVLEEMDEGVHIVDDKGRSIVYNRAMAELEKMDTNDVLQKPFTEVFRDMNTNDSTLMQALNEGRSTWKKEQTYLNKDGRQITTVNTTVPVISQDKVIAAVEIAKNITDIQDMTSTILELRKEIETPRRDREKKVRHYTFSDLHGNNREMLNAVKLAKKASCSSVSCIICGETGTGKELIARSIHFNSERSHAPFLVQHCASVPESQLERLLFGIARSVSDGVSYRPGLIEQAGGGTLLLDELDTIPPRLQAKLLRVLQEGHVRKVGGKKDIPVDVRIIATVSEDPEELISSGAIRKDLFYRIAVIRIDMPSLRNRRDDIILLAEHFLKKYNNEYGRQAWLFSEKAKDKLLSYDYPGNVRELENIIMGALSGLESSEHVVEEDDLIINRRKSLPVNDLYNLGDGGLDTYLENIEREMIENALISAGGNITRAAESLKIRRQTLQHKIKKYRG